MGHTNLEYRLELRLIETGEGTTGRVRFELGNRDPFLLLQLLIKVTALVVSGEVVTQLSRERNIQFVDGVFLQRLFHVDHHEVVLLDQLYVLNRQIPAPAEHRITVTFVLHRQFVALIFIRLVGCRLLLLAGLVGGLVPLRGRFIEAMLDVHLLDPNGQIFGMQLDHVHIVVSDQLIIIMKRIAVSNAVGEVIIGAALNNTLIVIVLQFPIYRR